VWAASLGRSSEEIEPLKEKKKERYRDS